MDPNKSRSLASAADAAARSGVPPVDFEVEHLWVPPKFRGPAPAGWYPDPAGSGQLRYYDASAWTWKTRPRPRGKLRSLASWSAYRPAGAMPSWMSSISDLTIRPATSLQARPARSRSGSVGGTLSLLVASTALVAAGVAGWQLYGTAALAAASQSSLTSELESEGLVEDPSAVLPASSGFAPETTALDESIDISSIGVSTTPLDALDPAANPAPEDPEGGASNPAGSASFDPQSPSEEPASPVSGPQAQADIAPVKAPAKVTTHVRADIPNFPPAGFTPPPSRYNQKDLPRQDGKAYGRIRIPAIGLSAAFVAGTSEKALEEGPGVWRSGVVPGYPGNATIAAHRTTYGAWFNRIDELKYGDLIYIDIPGQVTAVYEVRGRAITTPKNVNITKQTPGVRLTLSTCHPKYSASYRLLVEAEMVKGAWVDRAINRSKWKLLS